jgi:hypothetical protein
MKRFSVHFNVQLRGSTQRLLEIIPYTEQSREEAVAFIPVSSAVRAPRRHWPMLSVSMHALWLHVWRVWRARCKDKTQSFYCRPYKSV